MVEEVKWNGWDHAVRLSNGDVELVVTTAVGPRISRFAKVGGRNVFVELAGQQGGQGEDVFCLRGGHRFWIAPEYPEVTYEPDNEPAEYELIEGGVRTIQGVGPSSGCQKTMEIVMDEAGKVTIDHHLKNCGREPLHVAPWALSVMAPGGMAVLPLPAKKSHGDNLLHNQEWSLWTYTDLSDPRWMLGAQYVFFRQDCERGPNKLGVAHRERWVGYVLDDLFFVKSFEFDETASYPDGGVNFETYSNEQFLELESLGGLRELAPGAVTSHRECWMLHDGVGAVKTEADAESLLEPLAASIL